MIKGYSYKLTVISIVAVFVFTYAYDMLVHGALLAGLYAQSASVWRDEAGMRATMPLCFFLHFAIACVLTSLFIYLKANGDRDARKYPNLSRGLFFGVHIGLLMGLGMAFSFVTLPVSFELGLAWFAAGLLKGIGVGLVLAFLTGRSSIAEVK